MLANAAPLAHGGLGGPPRFGALIGCGPGRADRKRLVDVRAARQGPRRRRERRLRAFRRRRRALMHAALGDLIGSAPRPDDAVASHRRNRHRDRIGRRTHRRSHASVDSGDARGASRNHAAATDPGAWRLARRPRRASRSITAATLGSLRAANAEPGCARRHQLPQGLLSRAGNRRAHALLGRTEGAPVRACTRRAPPPPAARASSARHSAISRAAPWSTPRRDPRAARDCSRSSRSTAVDARGRSRSAPATDRRSPVRALPYALPEYSPARPGLGAAVVTTARTHYYIWYRGRRRARRGVACGRPRCSSAIESQTGIAGPRPRAPRRRRRRGWKSTRTSTTRPISSARSRELASATACRASRRAADATSSVSPRSRRDAAGRGLTRMCLAVVALDAHPRYALVVAANRDEYHARPAAPAHWWRDEAGARAAGRARPRGRRHMARRTRARALGARHQRARARPARPAAPSRGDSFRGVLADSRDACGARSRDARRRQRATTASICWPAMSRAVRGARTASQRRGRSARACTACPTRNSTRRGPSSSARGAASPRGRARGDDDTRAAVRAARRPHAAARRRVAGDRDLARTGAAAVVAVHRERRYGTRCSTVLAITATARRIRRAHVRPAGHARRAGRAPLRSRARIGRLNE